MFLGERDYDLKYLHAMLNKFRVEASEADPHLAATSDRMMVYQAMRGSLRPFDITGRRSPSKLQKRLLADIDEEFRVLQGDGVLTLQDNNSSMSSQHERRRAAEDAEVMRGYHKKLKKFCKARLWHDWTRTYDM